MDKVFIGIIPARYGSTRLEGKPLLDICGKSMIQRVYEQAIEALDDVFVATDDERIKKAVEDFGGKAIMTAETHITGTNRCLEAAQKIKFEYGLDFDVILNIQGDEPLLDIGQIKDLINCYKDETPEMATLVIPVSDPQDLSNQSEVFVTLDIYGNALYFSRAVIPYLRDVPREDWVKSHTFYKHLGMYAYTLDALKRFSSLAQSPLEKLEGLEQNRWLENGYNIKVGITRFESIPVDTQEDLDRVRKIIQEKK
ncbi:3-deoxy-manno-octulosonate cytidylyltransferase [Flexithrix dorotheae]|uniref:3-deoxy-manno-octulosonate cytidylyltransferase n=1 Tax=Flexithrix dorotheae TaxID=70993 RepID=UPI000378E375|nr:3-deoxy-manno-octulosonate cytidylyltransferase [Flexithrix dorotheae]